jgi:hypothetical protein
MTRISCNNKNDQSKRNNTNNNNKKDLSTKEDQLQHQEKSRKTKIIVIG